MWSRIKIIKLYTFTLMKEVEHMKKELHPDYHKVIFLDTSSDYKFLSGSTRTSDETMEWEDGNSYPVIRIEISSDTHPFYTGKQKADRVGGRVDRFKKKYNMQ